MTDHYKYIPPPHYVYLARRVSISSSSITNIRLLLTVTGNPSSTTTCIPQTFTSVTYKAALLEPYNRTILTRSQNLIPHTMSQTSIPHIILPSELGGVMPMPVAQPHYPGLPSSDEGVRMLPVRHAGANIEHASPVTDLSHNSFLACAVLPAPPTARRSG